MLSMKAKYALRAMTALAQCADTVLPARRVAVTARVPEKFLEAILLDLRRAGFIRSRRGPDGGHALARGAELIGLGDLIRAIDGPLAPIRCASLTAYRACDDCPDPAQCAERKLMTEVRHAMASVLDRRTLRDHVELVAGLSACPAGASAPGSIEPEQTRARNDSKEKVRLRALPLSNGAFR